MSDFAAYIDDRFDGFRAELDDFLRIPSVSTSREHAADIRRCAEWLKTFMKPGQPKPATKEELFELALRNCEFAYILTPSLDGT